MTVNEVLLMDSGSAMDRHWRGIGSNFCHVYPSEVQKMTRAPSGHRCGQFHQKAKLTTNQIEEIRAKHMPYVCGYGKLAKEYGCGESTIRDIVQYRTRYNG